MFWVFLALALVSALASVPATNHERFGLARTLIVLALVSLVYAMILRATS